MIITPELETVVILVPRTGSGSLRRAIAEKYPQSMLLYRHMEADGVPAGYDRWARIGVVRDPLDRLWSLHKFLQSFSGDHDPAYLESMRRSAQVPFEEWVLTNQTVFTSPYDSAHAGRFFPRFTVRHPLPENRKSQFLYLRPDLGTKVYAYGQGEIEDRLSIVLGHENSTGGTKPPRVSPEVEAYMRKMFEWDYWATEHLR